MTFDDHMADPANPRSAVGEQLPLRALDVALGLGGERASRGLESDRRRLQRLASGFVPEEKRGAFLLAPPRQIPGPGRPEDQALQAIAPRAAPSAAQTARAWASVIAG